MLSILAARQQFDNSNGFTDDPNDDVPFWWTHKGQIIRWAIFLGLLLTVFAFLFFGYMHARRRVNKGLPPLAYHRWMLDRHYRGISDPNYQNPSSYYTPYGGENQYNMHPMPPPVYDPNMPPVYQPPAGASKVDPSQWSSGPTRRPATEDPSPQYDAPRGPPPGAAV